MADARQSTNYRAFWSLLRRTRQRFQTIARDNPIVGPRFAPIIEAMAFEEAALIAQDPELPFRKGRGPRPPSTETDSGVASLMKRIEELEHAVRVREEHLAIVAHDLRSPLSPVMLLARRLLEDVSATGGGRPNRCPRRRSVRASRRSPTGSSSSPGS
jgi:signal transduction histidine kinase